MCALLKNKHHPPYIYSPPPYIYSPPLNLTPRLRELIKLLDLTAPRPLYRRPKTPPLTHRHHIHTHHPQRID